MGNITKRIPEVDGWLEVAKTLKKNKEDRTDYDKWS